MTIIIIRRFKASWSAMDRYFLSLAVTDLCVIVTRVFPVWLRPATGFRITASHDVVCKILVYVYSMTVCSSSWILATMAGHRALMVMWPHRVNTICTPTRSWSAVITIVVFSCPAFSHMLYGIRIVPGAGLCSATGNYRKFLQDIWLPLEGFLHSLMPMVCIFLSNVVLVRKLRMSFRELEAGDQLACRDTQLTSRAKTVNSVTLQAVVVSITFLVLTLPVAVWNASSYMWLAQAVTSDLHEFVRQAVTETVLYMLSETNYCVNFYIYCLTGRKFRNELKKKYCASFQRGRLTSHGETAFCANTGLATHFVVCEHFTQPAKDISLSASLQEALLLVFLY